MGFNKPIFLRIFDLRMKNENRNTEKFEKILKYCIKLFKCEADGNMTYQYEVNANECNGNR